MKNNKFQYFIIGFFVIIILIAVAMFASNGKNNSNKSGAPQGVVKMWGTVSSSMLTPLLSEYNAGREGYSVEYIQKNKLTFADELVEALASGKGPDLYIITPDLLWRLRDKISPIPFESFPERQYLDSFVSGANIYLTDTGTYAFPFRIDPLVVYYNRTLLESHFVVSPPQYWDDMYSFAQNITTKEQNGILSESAVALGSWDNVSHAKEIFSALLLQAGVTITEKKDTSLESTLSGSGSSNTPAQSVLTFYGEFANPVSLYYSWNEAKPDSLNAFISGDLALYFGFASELPTIRAKNPNLDFDVAMLPQVKSLSSKATYGDIYGIAIAKSTQNQLTSFAVAQELSAGDFVEKMAVVDYAVPARKSVLATRPSDDPYRSTFYQSGLIAKSWLDPEPASTAELFRSIIKSYTSGEKSAQKAILDGDNALDNIIN